MTARIATAAAAARNSSASGGSVPFSAAVRTASSSVVRVRFSTGRPTTRAARCPGAERKIASTDGTLRRASDPPTEVSLLRLRCEGAVARPSVRCRDDGRHADASRLPEPRGHGPRARRRGRHHPRGGVPDRGDDPQHRSAAPGDPRGAPDRDRARRRGDQARRAGHRLHAPRRGEARRVPRRASDARADEPSRLAERVQQRARLDDRRGAARWRSKCPTVPSGSARCSRSGTGS